MDSEIEFDLDVDDLGIDHEFLLAVDEEDSDNTVNILSPSSKH